MDTEQLWQAVLGEIELSLSKANFITWFRNTFIADYSNHQIIIGVPNTFTKTWLEKKYNDRIAAILKKFTKEEKIQIYYKVENIKNQFKKQMIPFQNASHLPEDDALSGAENGIKSTMLGGLNPRYCFENFVVGRGNELAIAACQAVSANPGKTYNPLFLYGGVGLGKTHLMQAVGNAILHTNSSAKILYVTCETFTNEYIQMVKDGHADTFKDKYRTVDILLVDDIQFLSGKEGTQEAFFHTFNELHHQNKQIVLSSDRPPKAIQAIESRLTSRFEWGMIADIITPDYETRIAILESKCKERNYTLDIEIVSYIATTIQNNVRELEGGLNKIIAYHHLNHIIPTLESVKNILATISAQNQRQALTPKTIIEMISSFYGISSEELMGISREKRFVIPRQISMYLMREELKSSFPSIGSEIGGRDHTTAMHAYDKIKKEIKRDDKIRQNIEILRQKLYTT